MKLIAKFKLERETKNALRYQEVNENPMIGQLYVQKSTFGDKKPEEIFIAVALEAEQLGG